MVPKRMTGDEHVQLILMRFIARIDLTILERFDCMCKYK